MAIPAHQVIDDVVDRRGRGDPERVQGKRDRDTVVARLRGADVDGELTDCRRVTHDNFHEPCDRIDEYDIADVMRCVGEAKQDFGRVVAIDHAARRTCSRSRGKRRRRVGQRNGAALGGRMQRIEGLIDLGGVNRISTSVGMGSTDGRSVGSPDLTPRRGARESERGDRSVEIHTSSLADARVDGAWANGGFSRTSPWKPRAFRLACWPGVGLPPSPVEQPMGTGGP